nr:c-type cytochrome [Gammaproteobacteria bacterium]
MSKSIILLAVSCLLCFASARAEQVGAQIYDSQCKSCHGSEGSALDTPILHGQEPAYIVKSLLAFKKEIRKDQIM